MFFPLDFLETLLVYVLCDTVIYDSFLQVQAVLPYGTEVKRFQEDPNKPSVTAVQAVLPAGTNIQRMVMPEVHVTQGKESMLPKPTSKQKVTCNIIRVPNKQDLNQPSASIKDPNNASVKKTGAQVVKLEPKSVPEASQGMTKNPFQTAVPSKQEVATEEKQPIIQAQSMTPIQSIASSGEDKINETIQPQVAEVQANPVHQQVSEPPMYHVFQDEAGNRYVIPATQDGQALQTDQTQFFPVNQVSLNNQVWSLAQFFSFHASIRRSFVDFAFPAL